MAEIFKWRIYCEFDSKWEYDWDITQPSSCPKNISHAVNNTSITYMKSKRKINLDYSCSPYTLKDNIVFCDTTDGNIQINLPKASRNQNAVGILKKSAGVNNVQISAYGSELIDGLSSKVITAIDEWLIIQSDGNDWTSKDIRKDLAEESVHLQMEFTGEKGDIIIESGKDQQILSVGTNSQYLVADSSKILGVKWKDLQKSDIGLENVENFKVKIDAITAPTDNDDSGAGYVVGSRWFDITTDKEYVCMDATNTAAIWRLTSMVTTGDLPEGSNFYYTDVRADARITTQKGIVNGLATLDGGAQVPTSQLNLDGVNGNITVTGTIDTSSGFYKITGQTCIMGTYFQDVESNAISSTTSDEYQTKVTLTTSALPSGKYRVGWTATIKGDGDCLSIVDHNDTTEFDLSSINSTNNYNSYGGFKYLSNLSGVQTFKIKYKSSNSTVYIKQARLEIWRIS